MSQLIKILGELTDNRFLAMKRLDNVCRKYGSDMEVKEMIIAAFKKLFDRGHIKLLRDMPQDVQDKINKNGNPFL